jgi:hypothetical protein
MGEVTLPGRLFVLTVTSVLRGAIKNVLARLVAAQARL